MNWEENFYPKRNKVSFMLYVKNLEKTFNIGTDNEIKIFEDLNLHIEDGKCTALLGSNGCGKTTLMNIISGSIMQEIYIIVVHILCS